MKSLANAWRPKRRSLGILAVVVVACAGTYMLHNSHAATPAISLEPENGSLTSGAAMVTDSSASGGKAVSFGGATTPTDPLSSLITTPAPAGSGSLASLLGLNSHYTDDTAGLDAAKAAGFTWIRKDLSWTDVEQQKGVYDFSAYDTMLSNLESHGMKPLWILDYGNSLYTQNDMSVQNAAERTAFGNFAEAAAKHFAGHGVRYEVWNEPDGSTMWLPSPDAAQYAALAQSVLPRIRAGDPQAKVTTGGLGMFDRDFFPAMLADGAAKGYDAVGVHTYWMSGDPESVFGELSWWRSVKAQYGVTADDWMTEFGYDINGDVGGGNMNGDQTQYAAWTGRLILSDWVAGFKQIIVYDTDAGGQGLLNAPNKEGYDAVVTLSAAAKGRTFTGYTVPTNNNTQLNAVRMEGPTDVVYALWLQSGSKTVQLPAGATATDMVGNALTPGSSGVTVTAVGGPVYVKLQK